MNQVLVRSHFAVDIFQEICPDNDQMQPARFYTAEMDWPDETWVGAVEPGAFRLVLSRRNMLSEEHDWFYLSLESGSYAVFEIEDHWKDPVIKPTLENFSRYVAALPKEVQPDAYRAVATIMTKLAQYLERSGGLSQKCAKVGVTEDSSE